MKKVVKTLEQLPLYGRIAISFLLVVFWSSAVIALGETLMLFRF